MGALPVVAAAAALLALWPGRSAAACTGDCNGDAQVRVEELVAAVGVALGSGPLAGCAAADADGDGRVAINELIEAVSRALAGCEGGPPPESLSASLSVAASPLVTVLDFGSVGGGSGGGRGLTATGGAWRARAARSALPRAAQGSGCITFECTLFGSFTGTEEVCCFGTLFTQTDTNCVYDDQDGAIIERDGTFSLESSADDACSGAIPSGANFTSELAGYRVAVTDPSGLYLLSLSNLRETFRSVGGGCLAQQPDDLGFGVRGDGLRTLDGEQRVLLGDLTSGALLADSETRPDKLRIEVTSSVGPAGCIVDAELDGPIDVTDGVLGTDARTTYRDFVVRQSPQGDGAVQLAYDGTVATDCLGSVRLQTRAPVRITADESCPTGGTVRAQTDDGVVDIRFTSDGGVALDFGADGMVDETAARCNELAVGECTTQRPAALCRPCSDSRDCGDLACGPCQFACSGSGSRCAPSDDLAICEDGFY